MALTFIRMLGIENLKFCFISLTNNNHSFYCPFAFHSLAFTLPRNIRNQTKAPQHDLCCFVSWQTSPCEGRVPWLGHIPCLAWRSIPTAHLLNFNTWLLGYKSSTCSNVLIFVAHMLIFVTYIEHMDLWYFQFVSLLQLIFLVFRPGYCHSTEVPLVSKLLIFSRMHAYFFAHVLWWTMWQK